LCYLSSLLSISTLISSLCLASTRHPPYLHSFPTRRSSDLIGVLNIKKARKHYKIASMLDTFALYIYFFNGLPSTYIPHSVKINSLNMEFAQENHALVN